MPPNAPHTTHLAIETSNPSAPEVPGASDGPGVALLDPEGALLAHEPLRPVSRHDDALLPAIEAACTAGGQRPRDIGRIAVSIGPGGYTAIRIAAAAAKMIALATGAELVGVPTADAVLRATAPEAERALVALAWKREDVWVRSYTGQHPDGEGSVVPISSLGQRVGAGVLIAEPRLIDQLRAMGLEPPAAVRTPVFGARAVARLARSLEPLSPEALAPLYPREAEALRKWRALGRPLDVRANQATGDPPPAR